MQDAWGLTALHWAASRGHEACVAALLSKGADPSCLSHTLDGTPGSTAADMASRAGHVGIAAFLSEVELVTALSKAQTGKAPSSLVCLLGKLGMAYLAPDKALVCTRAVPNTPALCIDGCAPQGLCFRLLPCCTDTQNRTGRYYLAGSLSEQP